MICPGAFSVMGLRGAGAGACARPAFPFLDEEEVRLPEEPVPLLFFACPLPEVWAGRLCPDGRACPLLWRRCVPDAIF